MTIISRLTKTYNYGFTLIELSIVIVIIGLLVGGVLVGRDLIKAAEIRAQISQIEEFKTATNTFKVKYGYLPGDMPATQASQLGFFAYTGTYAGRSCQFWAGTYTAHYGDNNGIIDYTNETYLFWNHLSQAKLIKGEYNPTGWLGNFTNANTCSGNFPITETKEEFALIAPRAKIANSEVFLYVVGNQTHQIPSQIRFRTNKPNYFFLAKATIWEYYDIDATSAYQSYQIDQKIDDGMPTSGDVRDFRAVPASVEETYTIGGTPNGAVADNPPCTTAGATPIQYDLSSATVNGYNCNLAFLF